MLPDTVIQIIEPGLTVGPAKPSKVFINGRDVGLLAKGGIEILLPEKSEDVLMVRLTLMPSQVVLGRSL